MEEIHVARILIFVIGCTSVAASFVLWIRYLHRTKFVLLGNFKMIYLNCNQLSSSGHLSATVNSVAFENVKTEYRGDEDITIQYVLDSETEASSRNWIGLYPKGAKHLDQYITFEWTIMNPCHQDHRRRSITFYAKYHMNNIEGNKEYFFIFVNKQMKVIGSSSYFHFLIYHTLEIEDLKVPEKLETDISTTSQSLKSFSEGNLKMSPTDITDKVVLQEICYQTDQSAIKQQIHLSSTHASGSVCHNISSFKADVTLTSPDFPISVNSSLSNNNIECCALCKRPANFAQIEQRLHTKVKVYAEYGHTLEKRIEELEKNFEMSQVAQKQLKLVAFHAKREKASYQKFVNEMLSVLTNKGAVRILDGHGTELLLKRVDNTQEESKKVSSMYKKSQREEILKSVISSQESTIKDLMAKLEEYSSPKMADSFTEAPDEFSLPSEIDAHLDDSSIIEIHKSVDDTTSLVTVFPHTVSCVEKNKKQQQHNGNQNTMNVCAEMDCVDHVLNETYNIDKIESEPISVILPNKNNPLMKLQGEYRDTRGKYNSLDNEGQGDFLIKSATSKESIHDLKQCVMKELTNVIRKRKEDKTEILKNDHSDSFSNESLNLSINETVQSMRVEEPNALIIKGDRLQYAIIRNEQNWLQNPAVSLRPSKQV